ncbi:hypothetical protein J4423_01230 [Candidatus Pacearchaeota archaeon]|nr:hypothetical protein [Candidatus Pacearchaeota archaeon]
MVLPIGYIEVCPSTTYTLYLDLGKTKSVLLRRERDPLKVLGEIKKLKRNGLNPLIMAFLKYNSPNGENAEIDMRSLTHNDLENIASESAGHPIKIFTDYGYE